MNILNFSIDTIGRGEDVDIKADLAIEVPVILNKHDVVIHVAGKAHVVLENEIESQEFYSVNLDGTRHLLVALKFEPKCFVFISTVSEYGLDSGANISENTPLNALEPYGKSKMLAESLVLNWGEEKSVKITILRLPLLFGIDPLGNLRSMIKAIERGYYFNIGKGNVRKSMVFAKDVSQFIFIAKDIGGIYNLTDGYNPSFKELSVIIASFYNFKKPISIPHFIVFLMVNIGQLIQDIINKKMPINKRQFIKMTQPLTFNDDKARSLGWCSKKIIDNSIDWLIK